MSRFIKPDREPDFISTIPSYTYYFWLVSHLDEDNMGFLYRTQQFANEEELSEMIVINGKLMWRHTDKQGFSLIDDTTEPVFIKAMREYTNKIEEILLGIENDR